MPRSSVAPRLLLPLYLATFYLMPRLPAQVVCFLEREQAPYGPPYTGPRDLPRLDGRDDGVVSVDLQLRWTGDYEEIRPRLDRTEDSLRRCSFASRPGHGQLVGDDEAIEPEIATQHTYGISTMYLALMLVTEGSSAFVPGLLSCSVTSSLLPCGGSFPEAPAHPAGVEITAHVFVSKFVFDHGAASLTLRAEEVSGMLCGA
jgi:hypothetical protein